jgi:uncharacterized protein YutD
MKKISLEEKEYEVIENYKDAFDEEALNNRYTSYFEGYDYILGDWAYGKLRLKGFCDKENKLCNDINDFANIKAYIENQCAYECKYFIIKKVK